MRVNLRLTDATRYAIAAALPVAAVALTLPLKDELQNNLLIFFFAAVVTSAYIGGLGPGLLSALLSLVLFDYFLLPPEGQFKLGELHELLSLTTFVGVSVLISSTVDRLRRAREEAEAANKSKMDFLAAMSHDVRTPLNAIAGYSEILELGIHGPLTEKQNETIGRIRHSQRHLLALVEQVLGFAKIEAGRVELDLQDVPLNETLSRVGDMIAPQARAKQLTYEFRATSDAVTVRADADRLDQIVLNLLTNAVKFTNPGGQVTLSCAAQPGAAQIIVSDTGPGIPRDKQATVFEPFVQLGSASRSAGVGLGLAISRKLARAMDGDITVRSEVGAGATFVVQLPRRAVTQTEAVPAG